MIKRIKFRFLRKGEVIPMTNYTTQEIKKWSTDMEHSDSLLALMNYYHKDCLMKISEEQALTFLEKLKSGEITIQDYLK